MNSMRIRVMFQSLNPTDWGTFLHVQIKYMSIKHFITMWYASGCLGFRGTILLP